MGQKAGIGGHGPLLLLSYGQIEVLSSEDWVRIAIVLSGGSDHSVHASTLMHRTPLKLPLIPYRPGGYRIETHLQMPCNNHYLLVSFLLAQTHNVCTSQHLTQVKHKFPMHFWAPAAATTPPMQQRLPSNSASHAIAPPMQQRLPSNSASHAIAQIRIQASPDSFLPAHVASKAPRPEAHNDSSPPP